MRIIRMQPDEVRIYPDGTVVEVYGSTERLVTDKEMRQHYINQLNKIEEVERRIIKETEEK